MFKRRVSLLLVCFSFTIFMFGCARPLDKSPRILSTPDELYYKSQKELVNENYEKAYHNYWNAVAIDSSFTNASYLFNILYSWVISQSKPDDIPLLNAQKQVILKPKYSISREELLSLAKDDKNDTLCAFGLGISPKNVSISAQRRLLAREAALADSSAWIARLAFWLRNGVESSEDVLQTVVGIEVIKEFWFLETIYVVKIQVPIKLYIGK
jgi:hypothetical protein